MLTSPHGPSDVNDLGGGLKTEFGAAVLFTGDFYRAAPGAPHPDNLWETFTRVQLEF